MNTLNNLKESIFTCLFSIIAKIFFLLIMKKSTRFLKKLKIHKIKKIIELLTNKIQYLIEFLNKKIIMTFR
jgi:hypothetical protein